MTYEIWSITSGNVIADADSEEAAWNAIGRLSDEHGRDFVMHLALTVEDDEGETTAIAEGRELLQGFLAHA